MDTIPRQPTGWAKIKAKMMADPLVPFGALLTAGILVGGIVSFRRGANKETQQMFMRARVIAQGFTLCAIAYGAWETATGGEPASAEKKN